MSQIWLQKSRIFWESFFVLATSRKVLSKHGNLRLSFPQNMATLALFPPKKSFVPFAMDFYLLLWPRCQIFPQMFFYK
jgi:hypothetical protein